MTKGESLQCAVKSLECAIDSLLHHRRLANDMSTYRHINDSHYLEKLAELELLAEQVLEVEKRYFSLLQRYCGLNKKMRLQLQSDFRWINEKRTKDIHSG